MATVPRRTRDLPRGTLKASICQAGLTEDEFQAFFNKAYRRSGRAAFRLSTFVQIRM